MSRCDSLRRIETGIISKLTELEELKMLLSFSGWESSNVNAKKRINASIKEIEALHKLTCLEIEISNINLAKEEICLPMSLEKYKILIGGRRRMTYGERVMLLEGISKEFHFGSWIHKLVSNCDALYLDGEGSINFDLLRVSKTVQTLKIKDSTVMKELLSNGENEKRNGNQNGIIIFSKLVRLTLEQLPNLTTLVRGAERIEFPLLEHLSIKNCKSLNTTTVSSKESGVCHDCNSSDSLHLFCQPKVKFNKLKRLNIKGYENANSVWCQEISICFYKTLERLIIEDCSNIKMLFLSSMVENLVRLKELRIEGCEHIEKIIDGPEEMVEICVDNMLKCDGNSSHVVPKLEKLHLEKLPNLTVLGKQIASIEFPMLYKVSIIDCPNLSRSIISSMRDYQNVEFNSNKDEYLHLFCLCQKVKFNCIRSLRIGGGFDNVRNIWCQRTPISTFTTLTWLEIYRCHNIRYLFSSNNVEHLVNLKSLQIFNCENMEEVVLGTAMEVKAYLEDEEEVNKTHQFITTEIFPKLDYLKLEDLPNLITFGKGIESMEFPILTELWISRCPNLRTSVPPHQVQNKGDVDINSLFCNEKVKFCRLERIRIIGCNCITSLFSSSMVENLVSLQSLSIEDCSNMEKVIAGNKVIHENDYVLLFPRLVLLQLVKGLPSLRMLCEWGCALQLPSLEYITINECPLMEFLTPGLLSVPKLNELTIEFNKLPKEEFCGMEDFNSCLRQLLMSTTKASSSAIMDQNEASEEEEIIEIEKEQT